jgi:hypothetical protein
MPTNWISPTDKNNYRLDGVKIYVGTTPGGPYDFSFIDVGYTTRYTFSGLPDNGAMYYVVATAYGFNLDGGAAYETEYSNEVSF